MMLNYVEEILSPFLSLSINTLSGRILIVLNVKTVGTYVNYCSLKRNIVSIGVMFCHVVRRAFIFALVVLFLIRTVLSEDTVETNFEHPVHIKPITRPSDYAYNVINTITCTSR